MYSALKRAGRPLYELARQGVEVERAPRTIDIRRLELLAQRADALDLVCECAKGTYIRVLGEDIARKLGTVGHLTRLRRTWVEPFRDQPMIALEAALAGAGELTGLLPPDAALQSMPSAGLSEAQAAAIQQGQPVRHEAATSGRRVRMYGPDGAFMGLAEGLPDGRLQPRRLLVGSSRKPML
jgi:tRNA pseudouridine55 synthase